MGMDLYQLKPGDRVRTIDGAVAEVTSRTEDGKWIRVRYVGYVEDPSIIGTEDLCHEDEILERVSSESSA